MGEAKRRALLRAAAAPFSKTIARARFNHYAIGTRRAPVAYMCEELSWWGSQDERLLGLVGRDTTDDDYLWIILARDRSGCFRCANLGHSIKTEWHAEEQLRLKIAEVVNSENVDTYGYQNDESDQPINLLKSSVAFDLHEMHPYFRSLLEDPGREPARAVLREIGPWLHPKDPHLVLEFQSKSFDQRLWEIYLWAALRDFALDIDLLEAPDFHCFAPGIDFTVEATTVAPSTTGVLANHPRPKTQEETAEFLQNYMPMKFGSALTSKLGKVNAEGLHYWERTASKGKPFLLAVADFHKPAEKDELGSMIFTQSALWQYLYGQRVYWEFEEDRLVIRPDAVANHTFGGKSIPSGFFDLPLAENVSGVIFSNAGTIAKFDRMGVVAGFGAKGYGYQRIGMKANPDPNAVVGIPFIADVEAGDYEEYWGQEIQVFHNPNARIRIPFSWFPGASHHFIEDGVLKSVVPDDAVLSSYTMLLKYV